MTQEFGIVFTVQSVSGAAQWAALLAWIWAAGFLALYCWDVRRIFAGGPDRRGRPELFTYHLVVVHRNPSVDLSACLDTLATRFPQAHLWVLDESGPVGYSRPADPRWRRVPTGPGSALARVRDVILADLPPGEDARRVIVGLLESGIDPDPALLDRVVVRGLLADRRIGGVQVARRVALDVRPRGRRATPSLSSRTLLWLQDLEERGPVASAQLARGRAGRAVLNGSGQFVRLSALTDVVTGRAGGTALARDDDVLDGYALTSGLWAAAWATGFTHEAAITGPGHAEFGDFLAERRRVAAAALAELARRALRSEHARVRASIGLARAVVAPLAYLAGAVVAALGAIILLGLALAHPGDAWTFVTAGGWAAFLALVMIAFGEFLVWGLAYGLRWVPELGPLRGAGLGLAYVAVGSAQVVAVWSAVLEVVRRLRTPTAAAPTPKTARPWPSAESVEPWASPEPVRARGRVAVSVEGPYVVAESVGRVHRRAEVTTIGGAARHQSDWSHRRADVPPVRQPVGWAQPSTTVAPDAPARQPVGVGRHRA